MNDILTLKHLKEHHRSVAGGKAMSAAIMARHGVHVPDGVCITTRLYDAYVSQTGLRERIHFELRRKRVEDMRWEEMWDTSLRIRNLFCNTEYPPKMRASLRATIGAVFGERPVVVRSSAPGEDSKKTSFAGVHESFLNIRGTKAILEHIRLVWASLWSDAAILYRNELGLDVGSSTMAVVIQEFLNGTRSGVAFEQDPTDRSRTVIEAVYGLNAGLVDGTVEPDRWTLHRDTGEVLQHVAPEREGKIVATHAGVARRSLSAAERNRPPLKEDELVSVRSLARLLSELFHAPQDVEWTFHRKRLISLQSRAITTVSSTSDDPREWHISLRRTLENLQQLRDRIEKQHIPGMQADADHLAARPLRKTSDDELLLELEKRLAVYQKWREVYWEDLIPFAHGARLFGQFYNDSVHPEDPHEFVGLLAGTPMESTKRNAMLLALAQTIREEPDTLQDLTDGRETERSRAFLRSLAEYRRLFGTGLMAEAASGPQDPLLPVIAELARVKPHEKTADLPDRSTLCTRFLNRFGGDRRKKAKELLELGQASYRLRDDDNIYLGRIGRLVEQARDEARQRGIKLQDEETIRLDLSPTAGTSKPAGRLSQQQGVRPRQLTGQPAGPGFAEGIARVIVTGEELFTFQAGEVLVCDSLDPNMTFVAPLAAGIVERRGGMLIHGAIVAREYGIPCVTGVRDAITLLQTGYRLKVDGYLGLVTVAAE